MRTRLTYAELTYADRRMPTYAELLVLCHEAAERRANKTGAFRGIHHDHAEAERMSLAFIQDRIDTDGTLLSCGDVMLYCFTCALLQVK